MQSDDGWSEGGKNRTAFGKDPGDRRIPANSVRCVLRGAVMAIDRRDARIRELEGEIERLGALCRDVEDLIYRCPICRGDGRIVGRLRRAIVGGRAALESSDREGENRDDE